MNSLSVILGKVLRKFGNDKKSKPQKNNEKNIKLDDKMLDIIKEYIEKTTKDCYAMEVINEEPTPLDTHMGGIPYMPKDIKWPLDKNGDEIPFLIQINFEKIELENFPNKGLLQVFYDWETREQEVRFYEELNDDYQGESCLPEWHFKEGYTCGTPLKLKLKKFKEVKHNYYNCDIFKEIFTKHYGDYDYKKYENEIDLIGKELEKNITRGNIGGWASSTQGYFDNMDGLLTSQGNEIFFFIDCMLDYNSISFGDGGYFWAEINPKDLKQKKYENIIIKNDCY